MVTCKVIEDLLPAYYDGVCSEETEELVDNHLKGCESCRNKLTLLRESEDISLKKKSPSIKKQIRKFKWGVLFKSTAKVILLIYVVLFMAIPAFVLATFKIASLKDYRMDGYARKLTVVEIEREKEAIGELEGYTIYVEDLGNPRWEERIGRNNYLEALIKKEMITLKDLYKDAESKEKTQVEGQEAMVYYFEDYQVLITDEECVISPIRK